VIRNTISFNSAAEAYQSATVALCYILPALVALFVASALAYIQRNKARTPQELLLLFQHGAIAVMTSLMLYPLESIHIAETKLFLSLFVLLYFLEKLAPRTLVFGTVLIAVGIVPALGYGVVKPLALLNTGTSYGTAQMRNAVGLPIKQPIAGILERQAKLLHHTVENQPYYVVDSSGGSLIGLSVMAGNPNPQYYIELRKGIYDRAVAQAVITELQSRPFVVVNKTDYDLFQARALHDDNMRTILAYVAGHYDKVSTFDFTPNDPPHEFIIAFYVLKRRN
jgi:hypothetical protein